MEDIAEDKVGDPAGDTVEDSGRQSWETRWKRKRGGSSSFVGSKALCIDRWMDGWIDR